MMMTMEEALQRIQEWRDENSSEVGEKYLSLLLAAVLSAIDFDSMKWQTHTPLHALASKSALEGTGSQMQGIVKLLKGFGLDIDAERGNKDLDQWAIDEKGDDDDGKTALIQAALNGQFALVQGLVEQGADVNKSDDSGLVPLTAAAGPVDFVSGASYGSHPVITSYLLEHGARVKDSFALHRAAKVGCPESVRILLKAGADVNERDTRRDRTPVQFCCDSAKEMGPISERVEALTLLLEAGADLSVKGPDGDSLMHYAAEAGHSEVIDVLVSQGLAVDTKNSNQRTPLHIAAVSGKASSMKTLIHLGASLDAIDAKKSTPLHKALRYGRVDAAVELIDAGANVNVKRDGGIAPIHFAAAWGNIKLAYLLLEAGAEIDALTTKEFSPLMVCMSPAKGDNVAALLRHGGSGRWSRKARPGSKEERENVAALLLEVGTAVTTPVMALAKKSDCGDVIEAYINEKRDAHYSAHRVCNAIAGHISGSGYSEAAKEGRVVRVRLVDRTTGKSKETQYTLSIPLMELLMDKTEQSRGRGEGGSADGSDRHDTAAGSLSNMLNPAGRGFMDIKGKAQGKGEGNDKGMTIGTSNSDTKDEVEVTFDGVDFTEEGFAAVMKFVTTGSVKSLLTRDRHGLLSVEGEAGINSSSSSSSSASGDGRGGRRSGTASGEKTKREHVKLFNDVRARQALQAADFFCIEAMSREVKALMTLYGFELGKETNEDVDEPPRKERRIV